MAPLQSQTVEDYRPLNPQRKRREFPDDDDLTSEKLFERVFADWFTRRPTFRSSIQCLMFFADNPWGLNFIVEICGIALYFVVNLSSRAPICLSLEPGVS